MKALVMIVIASAAFAGSGHGQQPFRLTESRLQPIPVEQWNEEQKAILELLGSRIVPNDEFAAIYAHHPAAAQGILPLQNYVENDSTLPPRHREILILRTCFLHRAIHPFARHVQIAKQEWAFTDDEISRVMNGTEDPGWSEFERALIRMADELHEISAITDETWSALEEEYTLYQLLDAVFTVADFGLVSFLANTVGVQPESPSDFPLWNSIPYAPPNTTGDSPRLSRPRVEPVQEPEWTDRQRRLLVGDSGRMDSINIYKTLVRHPDLYEPRMFISAYGRRGSTLSARNRETAMLRIGWLRRAEYEWGQHKYIALRIGMSEDEVRAIIEGPEAEIWRPVDAFVIRLCDELYRDAIVSDTTWEFLSAQFATRELIDLVVTVGQYNMVSMALNALGVQLEVGKTGYSEFIE